MAQTYVQTAADSGFNDVNDTLSLTVAHKGATVEVAASDADQQTIRLQVEQGSPGSGAWRTVKEWDHGSATIAYGHVTTEDNERLRLYLADDDGGTNSVSLSEVNRVIQKVVDKDGATLVEYYESGERKQIAAPDDDVVTLDAATYSATEIAAYKGKTCLLARSGGIDITLPAATGSGDTYEFIVSVATADGYALLAGTNGADFNGVIMGQADTVTTAERRAAGATDNTLTLGGTSQATGGSVGDYIRIIDIATNEWFIEGTISQGGTEATPFSAV